MLASNLQALLCNYIYIVFLFLGDPVYGIDNFYINRKKINDDRHIKLCSSIIDCYCHNDDDYEKHRDYRIKIARDRLHFWCKSEKGKSTFSKADDMSRKIRKDWIKFPSMDFSERLLSLYQVDQAFALFFILHYRNHIPFNINYNFLMINYYERQLESLASNDQKKVIQWCKNHSALMNDLSYSPYDPLRNMSNPCSMIAYKKLISDEQSIDEIQNLIKNVNDELEYLASLSDLDINYLEYFLQDLFLCGFCLDDHAYQSWLYRAKNIIDAHKTYIFTE